MNYPKIRDVEVVPVVRNGKQYYALQDPERISEHTIIVPPDIFYILRFLDGKHSLLDIRTEYMRKFGAFLFEEQLHELLVNLNTGLMLENEVYANHRKTVIETFQLASVRKAKFAGQSYLADPVLLKQQLNGFFTADTGSGMPMKFNSRVLPKAIIAPHIDIQTGGICYSHAYKILAEAAPADLFVILGIGHNLIPNLFAITKKHFETPLGLVQTDGDIAEQLNNACGDLLFRDELLHRTEHTIEFQVIFLQHVLKYDFKIVPILCSFDYNIFSSPANVEQVKIFAQLVQALQNLVENYDGEICFIASVDLAHIGPRYGDRFAPDISFLSRMDEFENKLFEAIENLNAAEFLNQISRVQNRYRICGFPGIYTLLNLLNNGSGELLSYSRAPADSSGSLVSFASMVIQ